MKKTVFEVFLYILVAIGFRFFGNSLHLYFLDTVLGAESTSVVVKSLIYMILVSLAAYMGTWLIVSKVFREKMSYHLRDLLFFVIFMLIVYV